MRPVKEIEQTEQVRAIEIDQNASATIKWNEKEDRFDITIHLIAENHSVEFFGHPSRGITTIEKALELLPAFLFESYGDYHESLMARF